MRNFWLCTILIALLTSQPVYTQEIATIPLQPTTATTTAAPVASVLPKGVEVRFVLLDTLSTATARKGQIVRFAVAQDVKEGAVVVIPRGTPAIGEVAIVRKSIPGKQNPYLHIEPRTILLANGTKLKVQATLDQENCKAEPSCWVAIGLMAAVEAIFLPIDLPAYAIHSIRQKHDPKRYDVREDFERMPCQIVPAYTARNVVLSSVLTPPSDSATPPTSTSLDSCAAH
jgi:hypothetical protein